jgi:alternate signal-mediated exported protein
MDTMNKMIKGSIAGATGIALLMGGFGTYALWSDSEGLDGGTVQSGALDITNVGAASWADVSSDATSSTWQADYKMVPGDKVTMTRAVTIDAEGKNLAVDFALTGLPAGPYWGGNLAVTATYDGQALTGGADDNGTPADTSDDGYKFTKTAATPAQLDGAKNLVVTFEFAKTTGTTTQQDKQLSLSGLNLSITQNRP